MGARYEHAGAAAATTLTTSITNVTTSIAITSATGWPTGSVGAFWVTIDRGNASEEKVLVTSRTGTTLTVSARGADGTTATSHASGAAIEHTLSATELDNANLLDATITGLGGSVVTTTATQTLTNKTLTAPTLTGAVAATGSLAVTGALTGSTGAFSGAVSAASYGLASGNFAVTSTGQVTTNGTITTKAFYIAGDAVFDFISIENRGSPTGTNATLYNNGGALYWRGGGGTVTMIAPN